MAEDLRCAECNRAPDERYRIRFHLVESDEEGQPHVVADFCTLQHMADYTQRLAAERAEEAEG